MTEAFLEQALKADLLSYPITSFRSDEPNQHPLLSLKHMPFFTFLEDLESSFVYVSTFPNRLKIGE
jgi:hypothetical protein